MHLHGEECPANNDSGKTKNMANCGLDIRLRRQAPVSIKPPRLRLAASSNGSSKGSTSRLSSLHTRQTSSPQRMQLNDSNKKGKENPSDLPAKKSPVDSRVEHHGSNSVSKLSGSSSVGRRFKSRSRAGVTSTTFSATATASSTERSLSIGSNNHASLSASVTKGLSRSCENVGISTFSTVRYDVSSSSNSGRPLIHHQRHNLKNRFQLLKTLGEGTYGKVKLAVDKTSGEHVAIKYIKKTKMVDDADLARIRREIQILSSLRHKHVVNIREVFEKKDKIVLVMDYAQGGELYDYLNNMGRLSEWEARRIFRQIVSAIHCCHQNGIVHRDLKLENIILDDVGNVKIADFGMANYYSHTSKLETFCGSPLYASPEIVNGRSYYGPEVDVWSLGVILYTLVYGSMPFESNSLVSLKQQISEGDYRQPSKPSDAAGLIRHMLTVTPSRRATIDDALRHWWINFGHANMPNGEPYNPCGEDRKTNMTTSISSSLAQRLSNTPEAAVSLTEKRGPDSAQQHTRRRRHSLDIQRPSDPNDGDSSLFEPPAIIHQRNQSSLSSDSDAELEFFRAPRWTQPQPALQEEKPLEQQPHGKRGWRLGQQRLAAGALDSTGNSVNSSGSASPAFNADDQRSSHENGRFSDDVEEKPDANKDMLHQKEEDKNGRPPSMLKLPPALMDILGGCSEKSLATLLSSDPEMNIVSFNPFGLLDDLNKNSKGDTVSCEISANLNNSELKLANNSISPNVDLCSVSHASDLTNNNISNNDSNQGSLSHLGPTTPSLTTSLATNETFVFDSERKPKRSILKRRGKFSGGEAPEKDGNLQKDAEDDSQIPKSGGGHLPRRLPSFRDEAHGIFASKHRASQLLEEAAGGIVHESCSSALLHSHHTPWGRHNATPTSNPAPCAGQIASLPVPSTGASSCSSTTQRESVLNSNFSSHPECSSFPSLILVPSQISALPSPFSNVPANVEHEPSLCRHEDLCHMPSPSTFASEKFSIERCQATHLIPDAKVSDSLVKDDLNGAYAKSQTLNADISNGNFLPTTEACFMPSFKKNGDLSVNDAKGITTFTLAMTNVKTNMQATGAQSYGLPTTEPSEEKSESNATSSKITLANPSSECATNNIVTTKLRVSSANSSPTRFSKTTSANGSSRSSASNSSGDSAYESSSLSPCPSTPSLSSFSSSSVTATVAKVIRRPASILRTSQLEQARNRLSVSSIGSNSSADILDLSYDSGDSDHYVNTEIEPARQTSSPECHGAASQKRDVREMLPSGSAMEPESLHIDKTMAFGDFEPRIPYRERAIPFDDLEPNMPCDDPDTEVPTQLTQNTGAMNTQEDLMYPCNLTRDSKQNSRTSLLEDVDLMIFPDEGHGVKLSASNRYTHVSPLEAAATTVLQTNHEGCETSSISPHNLNSRENSFCGGLGIEKDPLLFKPVAELDSAKSRLFQEDLFGTTTGAADRLSRPVVSNAGSTEQCFETMMSTLDLEQPQSMSTLDLQQPQSQGPGSHLEGVNIEAAERMVQITECGSPLLYRLTREAQTWL